MEVKFTRVKSQALFNDLTNKSNSTIYFIEDIKKIYLNGVYYGISPEDEDKFLKLTGGTIDGNINTSGTINFLDDPNVGGTAGSIQASWTDTPDGKGLYINGVLFKNEFIDFKEKQLKYIADGTSDGDAVNLGQLNTAIQNNVSDKLGTANGIATLGSDGKVPSAQLPSYVDDVLSYATRNGFPSTGESAKIYVAEDTNLTYRWTGTTYVEISSSLALGETSSTAYRGDRGKTAYDHSRITSGNPHNVSKSDVGLGSVQNYGIASQAQAETGTIDTAYMTPLKTKQAIEALAPKVEWEIIE